MTSPTQGSTVQQVRLLLRRADCRKLWACRILGEAGDGFLQAALGTYVLFSPERAATGPTIALAFALLLLPYSLVAPVAGTLLDRWSRKRVLVWGNLLRVLVLLSLGVVMGAGRLGPEFMVLALVALGLQRFLQAAHASSIPHVAPRRLLFTANALMPTLGTAISVLMTMTGAAVRTLAGGTDGASVPVIWIAAALVSISILPLRGIGFLGPDPDLPARPRAWEQVSQGVQTIRQTPAVSSTLLLVALQRGLYGAMIVQALMLSRQYLYPAGDVTGALAFVGIFIGSAGLGAGVGAVITPMMAQRLGAVRWVMFAMGAAALCGPLGFALAQKWSLLVAVIFYAGGGQAAKVSLDTVAQRSLPDAALGRMFSVADMLFNGGIVLGALALGFFAPANGVAPWWNLGFAVVLVLMLARYIRIQGNVHGATQYLRGGHPGSSASHK